MKEKVILKKLVFLIGFFQVLAYYFIGVFETPHMFSVACPQIDTLLYCQSAKQIAIGLPFIFTPGDLPSTGCTSHLYPFLLAIPYVFGLHGPQLLLGGFILNSLFYLIFLYSWFLIIEKLLDNGKSRIIAALLLAISGHAAVSAMGQSDVGLFMALSSSLFAAWLYEKKVLFNVLLVLAPWTRPEGMMLTLAIGVIYVVRFFCGEKIQKTEITSLVLGVLSSLGVLLFNLCLTGIIQFHSIEFKGYFKQLDFFSALIMSLDDLVKMGRHMLLGLPGENTNRSLYAFPLLGALASIFGILSRRWELSSRTWKLLTWCLACALGITSVAISGWQNTNIDRYLAWIFPIGIVFVASGITTLAEQVKRNDLYWVLTSVFVAFQCIGAIGFMARFALTSRSSQQYYDSKLSMAQNIKENQTVGSIRSSTAYALNGNRLKHLAGLYSPEFRSLNSYLNIEVLKHNPSSRFDLWEFETSSPRLRGYDVSAIATNQIFTGIEGLSLYTTSWEALDNAIAPTTTAVDDRALSARIDVGFLKEERKASFKVRSRLHNLEYQPFVMTGTYADSTNRLIDVGIPVTGWTEMTVPLVKGKDAVCVIRTSASAENVSWNRNGNGTSVHLKSPLRLQMNINGQMLPVVSEPIDEGIGRFSEIVMSVPGKYIIEGDNQIEIYGDHIAFCYWFYQ